ncbi:MAG TPA: ribosome biogenesis GTPase Der [Acidimicrobiia bacterium]|nr:ribosome biogenesis GTPase Der [Acidimicrobiia bacterium]
MSRLPIVAVVGRPNVGKSTLINRIIGRRSAVVEERPGVTRDRREFVADWSGRRFLLIDTGGWQVAGDELATDISGQAEAALASADVVLFVLDASTSIADDDLGVAALLRSTPDRVVVVANKVDDAARELDIAELWSLGLGEPIPISALHGRGTGDLLDRLVERLPALDRVPETDPLPRLAIVGRPNVGKSTLLNQLLKDERVLVSPVPGTTRDPIDAVVALGGVQYNIVDTAGIRRAPKVKEDTEFYSVLRAREALAAADVALLLIDSVEGVTQQDQRIAEEAADGGAGLIVMLNKWDIADLEQREATEAAVARRLGFISWAPVLRISAKTGARLHRLDKTLELVIHNRSRRIQTPRLNRLVREWHAAHPPPVRKGRRPHIVYAVQAGVEPPTIVVFVGGGVLGEDYLRFLENRIRGVEDFIGTPVKVVARRRGRKDGT